MCVLLAVLSLPGWWYLRHHWVPDDAIVRSLVLRPGLQLYVVRREDGGAPVPVLCDYYLSGRLIDRGTLGALMDRRAPSWSPTAIWPRSWSTGRMESACPCSAMCMTSPTRSRSISGAPRHAIAIAIVARPPGASHDGSGRPDGRGVKEDEGDGASVGKMQP
ncbi:MAG: hypothetical protein VB138_09945 [Burkholderia sp.]